MLWKVTEFREVTNPSITIHVLNLKWHDGRAKFLQGEKGWKGKVKKSFTSAGKESLYTHSSTEL